MRAWTRNARQIADPECQIECSFRRQVFHQAVNRLPPGDRTWLHHHVKPRLALLPSAWPEAFAPRANWRLIVLRRSHNGARTITFLEGEARELALPCVRSRRVESKWRHLFPQCWFCWQKCSSLSVDPGRSVLGSQTHMDLQSNVNSVTKRKLVWGGGGTE